MKLMKTSLIVLMALALTNCSLLEPKIIYVDRIVKVNVPQKCIVPDIDCGTLDGSLSDKLFKALECIANIRKASKVCK